MLGWLCVSGSRPYFVGPIPRIRTWISPFTAEHVKPLSPRRGILYSGPAPGDRTRISGSTAQRVKPLFTKAGYSYGGMGEIRTHYSFPKRGYNPPPHSNSAAIPKVYYGGGHRIRTCSPFPELGYSQPPLSYSIGPPKNSFARASDVLLRQRPVFFPSGHHPCAPAQRPEEDCWGSHAGSARARVPRKCSPRAPSGPAWRPAADGLRGDIAMMAGHSLSDGCL